MKTKRLLNQNVHRIASAICVLAITLLFSQCSKEELTDSESLQSSSLKATTPIGSTIWLKAVNGLYVCTEKNETNAPLYGNRDISEPGEWEKYTVEDAGDGYIALKANANGNYISAYKSITNNPLCARQTYIGSWEKFIWEDQGSNTVALYSNATGTYVSARKSLTDCPIMAWPAATTVQSWEVFSYGEVGSTSSDYPADVLDITTSEWKLNGFSASSLTETEDVEYVDNISNLATYSDNRWFWTDGDYVYFRAYRGTASSSTSGNPRSELREMSNSSTEAEWDGTSSSATNRMRWTVRVNHLGKSHVTDSRGKACVGQIHGNGNYDDVIRVQFEGEEPNQESGEVTLNIMGWVTEENGFENGKEMDGTWYLDTDYTFELIFEDGEVILNQIVGSTTTELFTQDCDSDENYFKAGNYMQSVQEDDYDGTYHIVGISYIEVTH